MKVQVQSIKEIGSEDLANTKEASKHTKADSNVVKVKVDNIVVRKGFNLRQDFTDVTELATSIRAMGLLQPITVDILKDGSAVLTDGERRYRALLMLREENPEQAKKFEYVFASTNNGKLSEADRVIAMMAHNSGKPLSEAETCEGFKRLRDEFKLDLTTIAKKVGRSVPFVEQALLYADTEPEEKNNVKEGKISVTGVKELARREKDPVKRKEFVKTKSAGGKKVKVSDIKQHFKQVPLTKECDIILDLIKKLDALTNDKKAANILFDIDAKVRALKELVRK